MGDDEKWEMKISKDLFVIEMFLCDTTKFGL